MNWATTRRTLGATARAAVSAVRATPAWVLALAAVALVVVVLALRRRETWRGGRGLAGAPYDSSTGSAKQRCLAKGKRWVPNAPSGQKCQKKAAGGGGRAGGGRAGGGGRKLQAAGGSWSTGAKNRGGATCVVSHYPPDPSSNDGYTTTAEGEELKDLLKAGVPTVAVPSSKWHKYRGKNKTVVINGKTYFIKDECKPCHDFTPKRDYDILVSSMDEAKDKGVITVPCSFKP